MSLNIEEKKYYDFACVITYLIKIGYKIEWEYPHNIGTDFDNITKYKEANDITFSYFISGNGVKNQLMKTQVFKGKIKGLSLQRSLLVAIGVEITRINKEEC